MSGELRMATIYERPRDYPDHFVVRWWTIKPSLPVPDPVGCLTASLDEARAQIPEGMERLQSAPADDASVVESWV